MLSLTGLTFVNKTVVHMNYKKNPITFPFDVDYVKQYLLREGSYSQGTAVSFVALHYNSPACPVAFLQIKIKSLKLPFSTLPNKAGIPFRLGTFRCVLLSIVWWGAKTTGGRQLCGESVSVLRIKAICKEHTSIKHYRATCYLATPDQVLQRVGHIKAHILPVFCKYNFKGNR